MRIDAANRAGALVIRLQFGCRDGPSAVHHPVAGTQVQRTEGYAAATPQVATAPERPHSRRTRIDGQAAYRMPLVERLAAALTRQPAAFEQAYPQWRADE